MFINKFFIQKDFSQIKELFTAGIVLTGINIATGLLGYVYQVFIGRLLSPAQFALFGAIIALSIFFSSPLNALLMLLARRVAVLTAVGSLAQIKRLYISTLNYLLISSLIFVCISPFFKGAFFTYLRTPDVNIYWLFILFVNLTAIYLVNIGFLQGLQLFGRLGSVGFFSVLLKIIFSTIFISLGFGIKGALSAICLSLLLAVLYGTRCVLYKSQDVKVVENVAQHKFERKTIAPTLVANMAFVAMTQLDLVFVNFYFESDVAGLYTAAAVLGKAVLYLPNGLVTVLFSMVAVNHARSQNNSVLFFSAVGMTTLCCVGIALIYWVYGTQLMRLFFGDSYLAAGVVLEIYGFAILPMCVVVIIEHFLLAKGQALFAWVFLALSPLQAIGIYFFNGSLYEVVLVVLVTNLVVLVTGVLLLLRNFTSFHK